MEINNLPVELTVVWNGHFNIDNPAQNKGVERLRLVEKAGRSRSAVGEGRAALHSWEVTSSLPPSTCQSPLAFESFLHSLALLHPLFPVIS